MPRSNQQSQSDRAFESIRNMIINEEIKPGYPIWETDIAEMLHMSRTPVREALQRLIADGLIYQIKNRGLFVKDLTVEEIEFNYQMTEALESMVAYLLARDHSEDCIRDLEECVKGMEESLEKDLIDDWVTYDSKFHEAMLSYCRNKYIVAAQERTNILIKRVRIKYTRLLLDKNESTRFHKSLLEAIKEGDANRARAVWQEHLSFIPKEIERLV